MLATPPVSRAAQETTLSVTPDKALLLLAAVTWMSLQSCRVKRAPVTYASSNKQLGGFGGKPGSDEEEV